jgi:acetylornithine deacetylase/succinyl-diaminopimelate desuccinylase-like protein
MTVIRAALAAAAVLTATAATAQTTPLRPDQSAFRALYEELVETNTTLSVGSCTLAAERMAARLKAAGYTDADLTSFAIPEKPKDGGLVAVLPGTDKRAKAILLLAHIDVVEAKREDWTRDPFTLIEENGFFFGRGVADDKAQAAIYTDSMIRMKAGKPPRRTVKLALTCGEETNGAFNGAEWLAANRRELIDAAFAMNEGGGGRVDPAGRPMMLAMQVGERASQNYVLEATNPGGHSSMPRADNAIYSLTAAIEKIRAHKFPVALNDTTRAQFAKMATLVPGIEAAAMRAMVANPADPAAEAVLSQDPIVNATMRTTCVVTLLDAGHAENALPQRACANVNCRILPGETAEATLATLRRVIADPGVTVTPKGARGPIAKAPPMDPRVLGPAEALGRKYFPGVPMVPIQSTGATDAIFLAAVGIPVYGVPGILFEMDGGGIHGLNERIRVKSIYDGRDYLHELIGLYANAR